MIKNLNVIEREIFASVYLLFIQQASIGEDGVLVSSSPSIYIKGSKEKPKFIRMWIRETAR